MDSEIKELKALVRRQIEVSEETNRMVRSMRRSARWGLVFQILWWLSIVGLTGALYYYYLGPYIGQIMQLYGSAQEVLNTFRPGQ